MRNPLLISFLTSKEESLLLQVFLHLVVKFDDLQLGLKIEVTFLGSHYFTLLL